MLALSYLVYLEQSFCDDLHGEVFLEFIVIHGVLERLGFGHAVTVIPHVHLVVKLITILITLK